MAKRILDYGRGSSYRIAAAMMGSEGAAEMYVDDRVDKDGRLYYLDREVSVSGARRDEPEHVWDDEVLEQQYRRFLNA